jgi:dienelactone hydrolase
MRGFLEKMLQGTLGECRGGGVTNNLPVLILQKRSLAYYDGNVVQYERNQPKTSKDAISIN